MPRLNTVRFFGAVLASLLAAGCGGGGGGAPTYSLGGTVSGLAGSGLVLSDGRGDTLAVSANGLFTIATAVSPGAAYSVSVMTQPQNPPQSCVVQNGNGTVGSAPITSVSVVCTDTGYTVGGVIIGLVGDGLVLQNNGGDNLRVSAIGPFTFTNPSRTGAPYDVTVTAQPTEPGQTCYVFNGSGAMPSAAVANIALVCTNNSDSAINGTYKVVAYDGASQIGDVWVLTFDGSGNVRGSEVKNSGGSILSSAVAGTYAIAGLSNIPGLSMAPTLINSSLTVTLTGAAPLTGYVSPDGNTVLLSPFTSGQDPGIIVGVKQGQSDFTVQNLAGTFAVATYGTPADGGSVETLTFDGAGNVSGTAVENAAGNISNSGVAGTYAVAADGTVTLTPAGAAPLTGGLSADGNTLVLAQMSSGQNPTVTLGVKQDESNFTNATMNSTYAMVSYQVLYGFSTAAAAPEGGLWTLAFDGAGGFNFTEALNTAGTISGCCESRGSYTVAANGSLNVSLGGYADLNGGVGANGTTFVAGEITNAYTGIEFALPVVAQTVIPAVISTASFSPGTITFNCTGTYHPYPIDGHESCSPAVQTATLSNSGSAPLYVFGFATSGEASEVLTQTSNCVGSLDPGQSCTVRVAISMDLSAPRYPLHLQGDMVALIDTLSNVQTANSMPLNLIIDEAVTQ